MYKGHDCANMELVVDRPDSNNPLNETESEAHDEITTYLNCRYVSAPDVCLSTECTNSQILFIG